MMKNFLRRAWYFIWEDDSLLSWIVNVVLAFLLVKFVVYPVLGMLLGTSYPVVAVISSSMEHDGMGFDSWWESNKGWYLQNGISQSDLEGSIFRNGFNKGDIIVLLGTNPAKVKEYDVIVYSSDNYKYPIIHRVVDIESSGNQYAFRTKGDNNPVTDPSDVKESQVLGKAVFRVPLLGWIKIMFTELIGGM